MKRISAPVSTVRRERKLRHDALRRFVPFPTQSGLLEAFVSDAEFHHLQVSFPRKLPRGQRHIYLQPVFEERSQRPVMRHLPATQGTTLYKPAGGPPAKYLKLNGDPNHQVIVVPIALVRVDGAVHGLMAAFSTHPDRYSRIPRGDCRNGWRATRRLICTGKHSLTSISSSWFSLGLPDTSI